MRVVVPICAMSLALCPSVKAQSESSLVGTWHLVSWQSRDSNGQVSYAATVRDGRTHPPSRNP
jgi:hypothetical protein